MHALVKAGLGSRSLVALITVVVALFGAVALANLPRELLPPVQSPELAVVTTYEEGTAAVVDNDVSAVIEKSVRAVPGVVSTTTTSAAGLSVVFATFATGTDPSSALQQVQREVDSVREMLPDEAEPRVRTGSIDDLPVLQAAMTGEAGDQLSPTARARISSTIGQIDGVRDATFIGGVSQEVVITPRDADMERHGVTGLDLTRALASSGRAVSTGEVTSGGSATPIEAGRYFDSVEAVGAVPLRSAAGDLIRFSDVADITLDDAPRRTIARVDGGAALLLSVEKMPEANTVEVAGAVEDALRELEADGVAQSTTTFNQAPAIERAVGSTSTEGLIGLICAALVVMVFLVSVRMTLIALISIPLSLLAAALALQGLGYSLNLLTLGALTLAIGRVVDDSIVVVESVERALRTADSRLNAVVTGTMQVARAVLASTLTAIAVFLPLLLVGGATGALFRPFALTTSIALFASLVVSLTIVPVLAFWFLKPSPVSMQSPRASGPAERLRVAFENLYRPIARFSVRRAPLVLGLSAVAVLATCVLVPGMPTTYITGVGQSYVTVVQQEQPNLTADAQQEHVAEVEEILSDLPGVTSVRTTIGTSGNVLKDASLGGGGGLASFALTVADDSDPAEVSAEAQRELEQTSGLGTFSTSVAQEVGFASDIEVKVTALGDEELAEATASMSAALENLDEVHAVTDTSSPSASSVDVDVDRNAALSEGLTEADVTAYLEASIARREVGSAVIDSSLTPVVQQTGTSMASVDDVNALVLPGADGPIPLSKIAVVETRDAPLVLQRSDGMPASSIFVTLSNSDVGGGAQVVATELEGLSLPAGTSYEIAGVAKDQSLAFTQLMLALGSSVLIVYVIMVAAFRSLLQPLVLLSSVPFAVIGVIIAQRLSGDAMGVSGLIGGLMLVGIAVTNAIVLVDKFNQLRAEGVSTARAAVDGATARLRPVTMTAAATVLALVPMALGITGHGGLVAQPLAIVVIGGMVSSTVLTLIVLPAFLSVAERLRRGPSEKREAPRTAVRARPSRRSQQGAAIVRRGQEIQAGTGFYEWWLRTPDGERQLLLIRGTVLLQTAVGAFVSRRAAQRLLGAPLGPVAALAPHHRADSVWLLSAQAVAQELSGGATTTELLGLMDSSETERLVPTIAELYDHAAESTTPESEPGFIALGNGEAVWMVLPAAERTETVPDPAASSDADAQPAGAGSDPTRSPGSPPADDEGVRQPPQLQPAPSAPSAEPRPPVPVPPAPEQALPSAVPPVVEPVPAVLEPVPPVVEPAPSAVPSIPTRSEAARRAAPDEVSEATVVHTEDRRMVVIHLEPDETICTVVPVLLGRNPDRVEGHASLLVPSAEREVSRTHALIDTDTRGRLVVTDLASANGTLADGRLLLPNVSTALSSGTRLQLGDATIRVEIISGDRWLPNRAVTQPLKTGRFGVPGLTSTFEPIAGPPGRSMPTASAPTGDRAREVAGGAEGAAQSAVPGAAATGSEGSRSPQPIAACTASQHSAVSSIEERSRSMIFSMREMRAMSVCRCTKRRSAARTQLRFSSRNTRSVCVSDVPRCTS